MFRRLPHTRHAGPPARRERVRFRRLDLDAYYRAEHDVDPYRTLLTDDAGPAIQAPAAR